MDQKPTDNPNQELTEDTLEGSSTNLETSNESSDLNSSDSKTIDATSDAPGAPKPDLIKPHVSFFKRLRSGLNIYLVLMIVVLLIAVIIVIITYLTSKHESGITNLNSQNLSQNTLQQLANSSATVGSSNQILNVESSAIFAGKVLLRQDLEVAGNLQVGGALAINDISVSGTAQIGQLQLNKDLSVAGNASVQGDTTLGKSLQVNGNGSFSGPITAPQITTSDLQLNSDLIITHHITAGGATPSISNGIALTGGGTASVSGSDTSGSITINTGSSPVMGCFATLTFNTKFNSTPHVLITPIGPSSGGLAYYVNRSSTSFSVCDATAPPADTSFGFDYWAVD